MSTSLHPANLCIQAISIQLLVHDLRCALQDDTIPPARVKQVLAELDHEAAKLMRQSRALMVLIS